MFGLFRFKSGWGFYCAQRWGDREGGGEICYKKIAMCNIARNKIIRQKYQIQYFMIDSNY